MIENTIRQIKESQAEKEKTRDVRQELEEFKAKVIEEKGIEETKSEARIAELGSKVKKDKDKQRG